MAWQRQSKAGGAVDRDITVGAAAVRAALRRWPTLHGLRVSGAGFQARAQGQGRRRAGGLGSVLLLYCARGGGWCRVGGRLHAVRAGDLAVVPMSAPHTYAANRADPWTLHWVMVEGEALSGYLRAVGVSDAMPVVPLGEDLQVIALFNEVLQDLKEGLTPEDVFHAAHTFGHLLSVLVRRRRERPAGSPAGVRKVGRIIDYLTEHHHEPLKVSVLASLVNLSPGHLTALFKRQTGCAPCAYLQLLRMHRAVEWLTGSGLAVKEIADRLGYRDPLHFSRKFKAFNGVSPTEFRANHGFVHARPGNAHSP